MTAFGYLERIIEKVEADAIASKRRRQRTAAENYERDGQELYLATFPSSRYAIKAALLLPSPDTTKKLCRAIWRDLQVAKALPTYIRGRQSRINWLRELYSCECGLYLRQVRALRGTTTE